ncbi:MAG: flagellar biosynthesis anti-sigma factor FlgM [Firmicutes bacterium]|nr:flagellar biosynthesis anti-sigma factor FlgM [Bacillota bacterium]
MNINNIQSIAKLYGEQTKTSKSSNVKAAGSAQKPDEVILSTQAQEVSQYLRAIKNMSEVRDERVNELAEQIASGEYKVDSRELADRIIAYSKNERFY